MEIILFLLIFKEIKDFDTNIHSMKNMFDPQFLITDHMTGKDYVNKTRTDKKGKSPFFVNSIHIIKLLGGFYDYNLGH